MNPPRLLTVLYEDSQAPGPITNVGPHNLALSCVADRMHESIFSLRERVGSNPRSSSSKLLKNCREQFAAISSDGRHVIAVFDNDDIRQLLKLPQSTSDEDVIKAIKEGCPSPDRLHIVLLKQNLESVIQALAECERHEGSASSPGQIGTALKKKDLNSRDAVLNRAAFNRSLALRTCILEKVPSWDELCSLIARLLPQRPAGAPPGLAT